MSDDIDIEEHDLLDDPVIKNIFPDLSKLKQEILGYDEEEQEATSISNTPASVSSDFDQFNTNQSSCVDDNDPDIYPSNEFLHDAHENETPMPVSIVKTQVQLLHNNKIILGSKPNLHVDKSGHFEKDVKPYSAKVELENVGNYLSTNVRYCKYCFILFPRKDDLEAHTILVHSADLNTANVVEKNSHKEERKSCHLCSGTFANRANLYRHLKNVHNTKKKQSKTAKTTQKKINMSHSKIRPSKHSINKGKNNKPKGVIANSKNIVSSNKQSLSTPLQTQNKACFHCKKVFSDQKALIDHIYSILQNKKTSVSTKINKTQEKQHSVNVLSQNTQNLELGNSVPPASSGQKNGSEKNQQAKMNPKSNNEHYYICHYCSYYFKTIKFYAAHVTKKHKVTRIPKAKKVPFNHKCKYCPTICYTIKSHNAHLHKRHSTKLYENVELSKENRIKNLAKETKTGTISNTVRSKEKITSASDSSSLEIYRCCYCSYYFKSVSFCTSHMFNKHKVQKIPKIKKISFDPKCKYCPARSFNIKTYNTHLHKNHSKRINEIFKMNSKNNVTINNRPSEQKEKSKIGLKTSNTSPRLTEQSRKYLKPVGGKVNTPKFQVVMLKSALFKCNKCDIHFLSIKTALDHADHMELLINWKCSVCHKIFKKKDKIQHEKQHTFSDVFTVYNITEKDVSKVLYKCAKCTIHSDVISGITHSSNCVLKPPPSSYCDTCGFLLANDTINSHQYNHRHKKWKPSDFIVIESEYIFNTELSKTNDNITNNAGRKRKIHAVSNSSGDTTSKRSNLLTQSYCGTCKCFLTNISLTRKVHVQSRCSHMIKDTCLNCGLVVTHKALISHQKLHLTIKDLKLQDYIFYDLKSGKQICPPIPDYHKCGICDTHFISKKSMRSHLCSKNEYQECSICHRKFWKPNYSLHMAFHTYSMNLASGTISRRDLAASQKALIESESNLPTPVKLSKRKEACVFLFECNNCNIAVDTYDKLIEHCQKHFSKENREPCTEMCNFCHLKFEVGSYNSHLSLHARFDKSSFHYLQYDIFYFKFHKNIWLNHLFGSRPAEIIKEALKSSIYEFEHRIKMEIVQEGVSEFPLYKCGLCQSYMDSEVIYKHIKTSCATLRKYLCVFCNLPFISILSRTKHEQIHARPDISSRSLNFRIVIFNRPEDKEINSMIIGSQNYYVFYQCRKCFGIVDKEQRNTHICNNTEYKECLYCGLLFNESEIEFHIKKHKALDSFVAENIKVVLFGESNSKTIRSDVKDSFRGVIYDYTFYRCTNCKICMKDLPLNHVCASGNASSIKCSKCNLLLYKHAIVSHVESHENDPDLEIENMNFIDFGPKTADETKAIDEPAISLISNEVCVEKPNTETETLAKIYKCSCGLHFLDESSITEHFDDCGKKIKIAKQTCSKCSLLFTTKVLFTHLLMHHGDKNHKYKLDIVEMSKTS